MKPIGKFANNESNNKYPAISVREHTVQELEAISLGREWVILGYKFN